MTNYFNPPNGDGRLVPFEGFYPDLYEKINNYGMLRPKEKSEFDAWIEQIIENECPTYYEI